MTNMNVILEAKDIVKTYGYEDNKIYATNHVDLQIEEGSFVAIVGRSGSGKSTLLHILAGLVKPTKGEVYLEGKSLYEMNDHTLTRFRRRRMGFVFQFFNLISTQNVLENIVLPIHLDDGEIDDDYLNEIINLLGLEEKKNLLFMNFQEDNNKELPLQEPLQVNQRLFSRMNLRETSMLKVLKKLLIY